MKAQLFRRYQKSIAMLIMTAALASMASAAGQAEMPPAPTLISFNR